MAGSLRVFNAAAVIVVGAAAASFLNARFFRLQATVAMALFGLAAAFALTFAGVVWPSSGLDSAVLAFISGIDFKTTLLDVLLCFLIFAGALHVDFEYLRIGRWPISALATLSVLVSTLLVGVGLKALCSLFGVPLPLGWCFVFGALISPTDPVATMALLQPSRASPSMKATIAGESLFNDGVGIVVFTIVVGLVMTGGAGGFQEAARMFALEAGGGVLLGVAIGGLGFLAMRLIDDHVTELIISVAMAMGGYALAQQLHVSGPVAMAAAGILIGNQGAAFAMDEAGRDLLVKFWDTIENILNAALFILIGLEGVIALRDGGLALLGVAAFALVLAARAASILGPLLIWRRLLPFREAFALLTWGGLRGGISIALALSLPSSPESAVIVAVTYVVVLISVLGQGSTIGPLIGRMDRGGKAAPA